ncbi:MAG TPA: hypothetical protein VGX92_03835 [Pyrinomonadaceae bacterium]|jgi:hypothetical protein|nr:hypothetical protein [Pyrinomonadaceae bacterium]
MTRTVPQKETRLRPLCIAFVAAVALSSWACAAAPSPDPAGPRSTAPVYATISEMAARREAALAAWANLTREQGITAAPAPELQPITQTLKSIPAALTPPLYLPKVGAEPLMTEEETRESLRRFIAAQGVLIGADPKQLSLVLRTDLADGTKKAEYQQHPFRYPLRGGYGLLSISFAPDRRILQLNSTCIPEVEGLQRILAASTPTLNAEQAAANLPGRTFTYADASGSQHTYTVSTGDEINVRELVVYPLVREGDAAALELHLAWEIMVGSGTGARAVYLDALSNKIIAASPQPSS